MSLRPSAAKNPSPCASQLQLPDSLPSLGHRFEQHESFSDLCHLAVVPKSLFTLGIFSLECNYTTETTWAWKLYMCNKVQTGKGLCCKSHLIPARCITNNHPRYWQKAAVGHASAEDCQRYVSGLCLHSWSQEHARGASWVSLRVVRAVHRVLPCAQNTGVFTLLFCKERSHLRSLLQVYIGLFSQIIMFLFFSVGLLP